MEAPALPADRLVDPLEFQRAFETAASAMPPFPDNMPENDLNPSGAMLAARILTLEMKIERQDRVIGILCNRLNIQRGYL